MMIEKIIDKYPDEELIKADGFDDAIIGVSDNINEPIRIIYSVQKCLDILEKDMSCEEALEHFLYNVHGSYFGEKTPIWCWDNFN